MTTHVQFGGLGGEMAEPEGSGKAGALVVVQEWHGLNAQMKEKVDRVAKAGYLALAPDLFHGTVATNDDQAKELMGALEWNSAVGEIGKAAAHLRAHPRCNGKVGVLGFCMGGALTFAAGRYVSDLACLVPFYGIPQVPTNELAKIKTPIQAHFAKKDDWAKPAEALKIENAVTGAGGAMTLFVYDAGHAFMRDGDPGHFDADASKLAWARTLEFLEKHLA
ncbi:MAG TPA: dienelactone hydrolase family protein [Polyangiaceae bacterium]|jgi:carboxymethylenebutenolidase